MDFFFNISLAFLPKCVFACALVPASSAVPGIGPSLQKPFQEYLEAQRQKLHHRSEVDSPQVRTLFWLPPLSSFRLKFASLLSRFLGRVSEAVCQCISRSWGTEYSPPGNVSLCLSGVFRNKTRVMEDSGSVVYSVVLILIELLHTLPDQVKSLEILPSPSIR